MSDSEAAEPVEQRRGPVHIQHPLEIPIDPETGDPVRRNVDGARKKERLPGKDRFGLDPIGKGWYRGLIGNIVRSSEKTPIGELVTYHFDLIAGEGKPPLPIEFKGYTFSKDIRHGLLLETYVGNRFPTERLSRDRFRLSHDLANELRAYMPVERSLGKGSRDLKITMFVIAVPFAVACGLTWLLVWALRHYHILQNV